MPEGPIDEITLPEQQPPNRGADEEFAPVATDPVIESNGDGDFTIDQSKAPYSSGEPTEPWEDDDKDTIGQIKRHLMWHSRYGPEEDREKLIDDVDIYESTNKNRMRVRQYVDQAREVLNEEHQESEEDTEGTPPPTWSGQDTGPYKAFPGGTSSPQGSEADRGQAPTRQGGEPDAEAFSDGETDKQGIEAEARAIVAWQEAQEDEDRAEYEELIADVEDEIRRQRLHTPGELPEGEAPELPFDLTTLSDRELQALYSAFNAYAYRVTYLLMVEDAKARRCRDAADEIYKYLLSTWPEI